MRIDVAVDIGNTRIKWGLCQPASSRFGYVASLADDHQAWYAQRRTWRKAGLLPSEPATWVLASVQPQRCERLRQWLERQGERVEQLQFASQLPLTVGLEKPDHVGIDRLLNAVAAVREVQPGQGAILVDAGSAVTVDWLDEAQSFRGGAIFPGLRLMAQALNQYTALLPLVRIPLPVPSLPGPATIPAMQAGIFWAVVGGIERAADRLRRLASREPRLFLTGGDASFLVEALSRHEDRPLAGWASCVWREQTLEGIRISAEGFP
jgi:type III pantothenate kinase